MKPAAQTRDDAARQGGLDQGRQPGLPPPLADAVLAIDLFAIAPRDLGGMVLRGGGPLRDAALGHLRARFPAPQWRRLPVNVGDEALLGGIDLAASLAAGQTVRQSGLIAQGAGGLICVPMAERLPPAPAGLLARAQETASKARRFALLLLDDGIGPDQRPPPALIERCALMIDLAAPLPMPDHQALAAFSRAIAPSEDHKPGDDDEGARSIFPLVGASLQDLRTIAGLAEMLGIASARALHLALIAARAHAARNGRTELAEADIAAAARLVLAPRATRLPPAPEPAPEDPETAAPAQAAPEPEICDQPGQLPDGNPNPAPGQQQQAPGALPEDHILEAVRTAIPADILAAIARGAARRSTTSTSGSGGRKARSSRRGRPLGAVPGDPRQGARLALIDTMRAAAPWQKGRRALAAQHGRASSGLQIRKDDLRIRRFEDKSAALTIFAVDASGSAAFARLAEAKGAVELILAKAYVTRTEVALLAFRGDQAQLLLPPTRSLTRARRALASLPGGGGTPLAAGLELARQVAQGASARGQTPFIVFLTDGSGNIGRDGTPGRAQARKDAAQAARALAAEHIASVVIDISARPRPDAAELAADLCGRYLPLPLGDAARLQRAVAAAQAMAEDRSR